MLHRAYLSVPASEISTFTDADLFGQLASKLPFPLELTQRAAWAYQIEHLRHLARELPSAHFFMEFLIPRMGRRIDLVAIYRGIAFVIEYKLGATHFERSSLEQVYGYALDLKYFHEGSHNLPIVPILVATEGTSSDESHPIWDDDGTAKPLKASPSKLATVITKIAMATAAPSLNPLEWVASVYRPTPTIVEAAQALYQGHAVEEISRSEAGAKNLTRTATCVAEAIEAAKRDNRKIICFLREYRGLARPSRVLRSPPPARELTVTSTQSFCPAMGH
jgi:hypothetical protein